MKGENYAQFHFNEENRPEHWLVVVVGMSTASTWQVLEMAKQVNKLKKILPTATEQLTNSTPPFYKHSNTCGDSREMIT